MSHPIIVCPWDRSPGTRRALAQAIAIARARHAKLHLLHVAGSREESRSQADAAAGTHPATAAAHTSVLAALLEDGEPLPHRFKTLRGNPARVVGAYARREGARLIVLRAGYGTWPIVGGTPVARRLGRTAPCPVLVVPDGARRAALPPASFHEVVCAMDDTRVSVQALRAAAAFLPPTGARMTLVHALDPAGGMAFSGGEGARLARRYESLAVTTSRRLVGRVPSVVRKRCRVEVSVASGLPHRRILSVASQNGADLIVMGLPPRGRLAEVLVGSTSHRVLRGAKCPVLLVPPVTTAVVVAH